MLALILLPTLLSGCAGQRFRADGCPIERKYTKAEQDQFLADLPKTPPSVQSAMADYLKLRDKARACRGVTTGLVNSANFMLPS